MKPDNISVKPVHSDITTSKANKIIDKYSSVRLAETKGADVELRRKL